MKRILLRVYITNDELPEQEQESILDSALRQLKLQFGNKLQTNWVVDLHDSHYELVNWRNYKTDLVRYSKSLKDVYFFILEMDSMEIKEGECDYLP